MGSESYVIDWCGVILVHVAKINKIMVILKISGYKNRQINGYVLFSNNVLCADLPAFCRVNCEMCDTDF